jgi:hypothetical protein
MLYRLRPPGVLEWADAPGFAALRKQVEQGADLDLLVWQPTEERVFSTGMLRIALRHGVVTGTGIVVSVEHTLDLGHGDTLRAYQMQSDEAQSEIRASHGELLESLMPGWTASGEELDERVRASTEKVAREAEANLAEVMAAPVRGDLAAHWARLGGSLPAEL